MKKCLVLVMVLALLLCSCGSNQSNESSNTSATESHKEEKSEKEDISLDSQKEESVEEASLNSEEKDTSSASESSKEEEKEETSSTPQVDIPGFNTTPSIEETVLFENDDVKVTATALEYSRYNVDVKLTFENNGDVDYEFLAGTLGYGCNSINGYTVSSGYLNKKIAAGKKGTDTVSFRLSEIQLMGLTEIAEIGIGLKIQDSNRDVIFQGPCMLRTSVYDNYDFSVDYYRESVKNGVFATLGEVQVVYYAEDVLYNTNGISLVSELVGTNVEGEPALLLELYNKSDTVAYVSFGYLLYNGICVSNGSWTSDYIMPGGYCVTALELTSILEQEYWGILGIESLKEIGVSLVQKDEEYNNVTEWEPVTIKVTDEPYTLDLVGQEIYNDNGVRVVFKGLANDPWSYTDAIHALFLVLNDSGNNIYFEEDYESVSVNGYMADYFALSLNLDSGYCGIFDLEIDDDFLEEIEATKIEDISEIELTIIIRDSHYSEIDIQTATIVLGQE